MLHEDRRRAGSFGDDAEQYDRARALEANGGFSGVVIRSFSHSVRYTTAQWLDQLPTHSDHRVLPEGRRAEVLAAVGETIDRFGGQFEMFYATWLVEAQKTG